MYRWQLQPSISFDISVWKWSCKSCCKSREFQDIQKDQNFQDFQSGEDFREFQDTRSIDSETYRDSRLTEILTNF